MSADPFEAGEEPLEEPEPYRPPVPCPQCGRTQTRFLILEHEMSVYACELCGLEFEVEEPEA